MKKRFVLILALVFCIVSMTFAQGQNEKTITLLETSDIHGAFLPYDYASDSPSDGSWAQLATVIKQERKKDPTLLLVDCGDTSQDNMIQEFRNDSELPVPKALNLLKYDAWELGNHEFNFEFKNLQRAISQYNGPTLAANIYKKDGTRFVQPYIIKKVQGVRVAIFGLIAPHISKWEASDSSHFDNMTFTTPLEETARVLKELEGKADIIICLAHYGEDGEYDTMGMKEIAEKYGDKIAAFLIGHEHSTLALTLDNGTVLGEPGSKGSALIKVQISLNQRIAGGKWFVVKKTIQSIPIKKANIPSDSEFTKTFEYIDTKSKQIANTSVGKVGADFLPSLYWHDIPGIPTAVLQDTAMIDLINAVQMDASGADVSLAALFNASSNLPAGDFHKRDGVKIYMYDNTLMAVRVTGKQLKAIMEQQAGNFFNAAKSGDVTISFNPKIRMYNYDMFAGVSYDIDISKPLGQRIVNVTYKGKPLSDDQILVLALNNYRYGGLSTSNMISNKPDDLVYNSGLAIRDLISEYVVKAGVLMPSCDNNWKIIGIDLNNPDAEKVYQLVRDGKIKIPTSEDGRTPNIASLNVNNLKKQGLI